MLTVLVWQWGRRGGGPRIAVEIAEALDTLPGVRGLLSLSDRAEVLAGAAPPRCDLAVPTYDGLAGFFGRLLLAPLVVARLLRWLRAARPALAICAMPGPLDPLMLPALRLARVKLAVVVHDADPHPGEIMPLMVRLQRHVVRRADLVVTLSAHVAERLRAQRLVRPGVTLAVIRHPPRRFGTPPPARLAHGGPLRLLFFGRLLPYKGLDLLAEALRARDASEALEVRIVGSGPESPALDALRRLDGVTVENRWVPEDEIAPIIAWSDALVLPYREASQSGAAAAAMAGRRFVVATAVGGLAEQLDGYDLARLCAPDPVALAQALSALLAEARAAGTAAAPEVPADGWPAFARSILQAAEPLDASQLATRTG